jgi:hypothetical protein
VSRTRIVIVSGLLLATAATLVVVLVPRWVKARIVAAAAAHGVALTIGDLSIIPGRARLKDVRAAPLIHSDVKGAPSIAATAAIVDVTLDWLTPTAVAVSGAALELDGLASVIDDALLARDQSAGGGTSSITSITLTDSTLTWKHPIETNLVTLHAAHMSGNVTRKPGRALGDDWHFETAELRAFDPGKQAPLVAWAVSADGDAAGKRATVTLAKGAQVKFAVAASGARTLDIDTPNTTVKDLGIPAEALSMYGDDASHFELHLHHEERDKTHAEGTLVAVANGVFLGASPGRTELALDARYAGDPQTALKITGATLRAGPFTGALVGTFAVDPAHISVFKADLRYESALMSCLDAVKSQAASYGDLGKGVAALAGMLGLDRAVQGTVKLLGEIRVDTQQTSVNHFSFRTQGDCKLSYLPFG